MKMKRMKAAAATKAKETFLFDHSYADFKKVLSEHVAFNEQKTASTFDYVSFDPSTLETYFKRTTELTKAQFDQWSANQQLAFLINLYNARTVARVMTKYPIESFKELGSGFPRFKSPWQVKFFDLFGEESHLDRLEHELVRETDRYNDPRIHFGFNCASIGCPALLDEPFQAETIDAQLEVATNRFLQDSTRNRYDLSQNTFYISKIFQWYRGDFEKGHKGYHSLEEFLIDRAENFTSDPKALAKIREGQFRIRHLSYDWSLNDRPKNSSSEIR